MNIKNTLKETFPALSHKDFKYFWTGQCVSLIGTWMQNTGQSWLILTLTDSPFLLGLVNALQFLPMLIFSLFSGVIIDKFSKKRLLIFTQISFAVLAFILAILVWSGKVTYWYVLILAALLGCINTIDMPTRQAFVIDLVGKNHVMNAVSLNSAVFNGAKIIGPAISGMCIHYFGMAPCFFINAISFIPVIWSLFLIKTEGKPEKVNLDYKIVNEIKKGLLYIKREPILMETVILMAVVGVFLMNFNVMIPLLAKNVLNEKSMGYGFLMSVMGIGCFLGALSQVLKSKSGPKKHILYKSGLISSVILILIGSNKSVVLESILLLLTGFFNIWFITTTNSLLQLNSSREYRGRVMSVYALVSNGLTPLGSLFSGSLSSYIGVSNTFILSGIIIIVFFMFIIIIKNKGYKNING